MRVSICIPHRSESLIGLWATIASCEMSFQACPHEYIVCVNGREKVAEHDRYDVTYVQTKDAVGPAGAREVCASYAKGDYLLFLDDHVVVNQRAIMHGVKADKDILFFPSHCGDRTYYDYEVELSVLSRMDATIRTKPRHDYLYRCMAAPAGQFMVKRSAWEKMGGYGGIFDGYNGEEVYFGMRAAMFNLESWISPQNICWHYVPQIAPNWKNRDDAFFQRFERGLETLKNLKAEKTLDEAFGYLAKLNDGAILDDKVRDHVGAY